MKTSVAGALGARTLLALTCWHCGRLRPGDRFERYSRGRGPAYIDRRCLDCRWRHLDRNPRVALFEDMA